MLPTLYTPDTINGMWRVLTLGSGLGAPYAAPPQAGEVGHDHILRLASGTAVRDTVPQPEVKP